MKLNKLRAVVVDLKDELVELGGDFKDVFTSCNEDIADLMKTINEIKVPLIIITSIFVAALVLIDTLNNN